MRCNSRSTSSFSPRRSVADFSKHFGINLKSMKSYRPPRLLPLLLAAPHRNTARDRIHVPGMGRRPRRLVARGRLVAMAAGAVHRRVVGSSPTRECRRLRMGKRIAASDAPLRSCLLVRDGRATLPSCVVSNQSIRTACVFFNTTRTPLSVSPVSLPCCVL